MYSANRKVAIIKPKEPYLDWSNSLSGISIPCNIEELNHDCTMLGSWKTTDRLPVNKVGFPDEGCTYWHELALQLGNNMCSV